MSAWLDQRLARKTPTGKRPHARYTRNPSTVGNLFNR